MHLIRLSVILLIYVGSLSSVINAQASDSALLEIEAAHFEFAQKESDSLEKLDFSSERTRLLSEVLQLAQSDLNLDTAERLFAVASTIKLAVEGPTPETLYDELTRILEERNVMTNRMIDWRHTNLVAARRFDAVEALEAEHPHLESTLYYSVADTDRGTRRTLVWDMSQRRFVQTTPVQITDFSVVIIASPHCGFSQAAENAIGESEELRAVFESKALWLLPPDYDLSLANGAIYGQYNPPGFKRITYLRSDFPEISSWDTPTFYFFRQDELIEKHVGWRSADSAQNVEKLLSITRRHTTQKAYAHQ